MDKHDAAQLHAALNQFIGSLQWTKHWIPKANLIYSEGVAYLAEHGNCFWLLDAIASYYAADGRFRSHIWANRDFASLHFWKLLRRGDGARLWAELDAGEPPVVRQHFEYTTFPFGGNDEFTLYAAQDNDSEPFKLFLPSEY